jgi:penicillin-binding protein 1A
VDVRGRPTFRNLAALGIVGFLTPIVCAGVALGALIFLPLPATLPEARLGIESSETHIFDSEGNQIAVLREFETRTPVTRAEVEANPFLRAAVVAAEDRNFYSHGGIDLRGTLRALWTDVRSGEAAQGGSTITQQYVRAAYERVGTDRSIARKIREAILASQLDREVDKDEILFRYLDTIYFGEGAYGVGAASATYFRKPVAELTLSEAAVLAGVIPAPTAYSPRDNVESAETKRRIVLDAMLEVGAITPEQHAAASGESIWLLSWGPPPDAVPHTFVHPPTTQSSERPWFTDYVRRWIEQSGEIDGCVPGDCPPLTRGGLTIHTTLDPRAQDAAEEEVADLLDGTDPTLEASIVAVEPPTGFVRALVGGRNFGESQVNTALRQRQPGSSFKPIVLAEAFEQGIRPEAVYSGSAYTVGGYTAHNYNGASYGRLSLRSATTNSVNGVFARLIEDVTVRETFDMATRLGVSMPGVDPEASEPNVLVDASDPTRTYGLSVALGAIETSPLEMAGAYAVFANHGRRAAPTPVLQVLGPDPDGPAGPEQPELLIDNTDAAERATEVLTPEVADNVTDVLRGVVTDGTASGRGLPGRASAGKTGTAQAYGNAWFVGYTPTLSTAVWIGYRDCNCPLEGIRGVGRVTGGSLPARTWQSFMTRALDGIPVTEFADPAPIPDIRDEAERQRRGGFDPGRRRYPSEGLGGGDYVEGSGDATVDVPETTTTLDPATTTSSTPDGGGGGGGGGGGDPPPTTPFTLIN